MARVAGPIPMYPGVRLVIASAGVGKTRVFKLCTINRVIDTTLQIKYDGGMSGEISVNSPLIVGTAKPNLHSAVPYKDIDENFIVETYYSAYDRRDVEYDMRDFDNRVMRCIIIKEDGSESVAPEEHRFNVNDIVLVTTKNLPEEESDDIKSRYGKVINRYFTDESISGVTVKIPTYDIQQSYSGISTEDWSQQIPMKDMQVNGDLMLKFLPPHNQDHIRKFFFNQFMR